MFGVAVLAVAVPEAFGTRGLVFAGAYVAVQADRSLFLMVVTWRGEHRVEARQLFWYGVSALPWLVGAVAQGWVRGGAVGAGGDRGLHGAQARHARSGDGRVSAAEFPIAGEFVAERQRQFVIIALGELILVTELTVITSSSLGAGHTAAAVVAFATAALLWRISIYRAGEIPGAAIATAPDPFRITISTSAYAHPVMVAGLIAISVSDELVITHPAGHMQPAWTAVILSGPALFLAGVAIADTARARRHPDEPPSPLSGGPL